MMKNIVFVFLFFIIVLINTGCWDRVEVNKRSYIMGIAIDEYNLKNAPIQSENEKNDTMFNFTFEISALKSAESAKQAGNFKKIVAATNVSQALDLLESTVQHPSMLTHLQAVVVGEKVAEKGIIQIADFLIRDSEVRRRTKVFISKGKAADIFDYTPRMSNTVGEYLNELPANANNTSFVLVESDLGTISYSLANRIDFLLPKVYTQSKSVVSKGGAILNQEGKLIGWVDNGAFEGARWIRGLYERGNVVCECPITKKSVIVNIKKSKTKIHITQDDSVVVDIKVEGSIATNLGGTAFLTKEYINEINKDVRKSIKDKVNQAINYFQKDIQADVFFLNVKFKHYKNETWKAYKDNWNEYFSSIVMEVNVASDIENIGSMTTIK